MSATIHRADVVGKAKNAVGIRVDAPLQCCFHGHAIFFSVHIDNFWMQRIFLRIHIGNVFLDATFVEIQLLAGLALFIPGSLSLIAEHDAHTTIQISQLSQTGGKRGVIKLNSNRENLMIRLKANAGASKPILLRGLRL